MYKIMEYAGRSCFDPVIFKVDENLIIFIGRTVLGFCSFVLFLICVCVCVCVCVYTAKKSALIV